MRPLMPSLAMPMRRGATRVALLIGLPFVLVLAMAVAGTVRAHGSPPGAPLATTTGCGLPRLDPGTHVALVDGRGGRRSTYVVPGRDAGRTGEVELLLTMRAAPVFLVLVGDEPLIWRLGVAPEVELAGVVVAARHPQVLAGLPEGVLVRRFTGPGAGEACHHRFGGALAAPGEVGRDADSIQQAAPVDAAGAVRALVGPPSGIEAALRRLATDTAVARLVPRREAEAR